MRASHGTEKHKRERRGDCLWRATFNSGWKWKWKWFKGDSAHVLNNWHLLSPFYIYLGPLGRLKSVLFPIGNVQISADTPDMEGGSGPKRHQGIIKGREGLTKMSADIS